MGEEDSQWKLERSDLPIQGSSDGTITTTTTAGTQFVPGAFRMTPPAADQQANTPKTSTGLGGNDLDQYFSNGFLKNGVDDQSSPAQIAGQAGEPIAQDPPNRNLVQESETLPPDDSKVTYDPAETQSAFGALVGWVASWFDGEEATAVSGATLPAKPKSPQELFDERNALQAEIESLEAALGRALTWYEQELKKDQAKGLTTHQIEQSITMRQHREATRKSWDRLQELKKKLQVVVVVLQTEHPQILNAEEQRKLQEAAYARLKDKKFSPQEFDKLFEGASVFRDDGQLILKEGDVWTVFKFHPAQYVNTMAFPPSGPFVSANYVKLVEPAYWQLHGRFPATLSFRSIQEMQGILAELGSSQQLQIVAEFALHVVPFGTLTDKIATGEGGDWDEVLLTTAGDALFVVSFGFGGTTAAARLAQARIAAGSVGVNLFGAGYETFKASTDEEGLTTARGANIFAGLLFAMLDAKELRRLQALRIEELGHPLALRVGNPKNPDNRIWWEAASAADPLEGYYDVIGHGNGRKIAYTDRNPIDAATLAKLLKNDPSYKPGTKVRLLVCWAGYYTDGLAAELALLLGTEVLAASSRVSVVRGRVSLWNNVLPRARAAWYRFLPDGGRVIQD